MNEARAANRESQKLLRRAKDELNTIVEETSRLSAENKNLREKYHLVKSSYEKKVNVCSILIINNATILVYNSELFSDVVTFFASGGTNCIQNVAHFSRGCGNMTRYEVFPICCESLLVAWLLMKNQKASLFQYKMASIAWLL